MKQMGKKSQTACEAFAGVAFGFAAAVITVLALQGCGYGKQTCQAIDMINTACPPIVQFIGSDGGAQSMRVSREDFISVQAGHSATAKDAGAK